MTETEAKTKWCAMVRFIRIPNENNPNMVHSNRGRGHMDQSVASYLCIGSACMMWRQEGLIQEKRDDPDYADKKLWTQQTGYCGLAGKPE